MKMHREICKETEMKTPPNQSHISFQAANKYRMRTKKKQFCFLLHSFGAQNAKQYEFCEEGRVRMQFIFD